MGADKALLPDVTTTLAAAQVLAGHRARDSAGAGMVCSTTEPGAAQVSSEKQQQGQQQGAAKQGASWPGEAQEMITCHEHVSMYSEAEVEWLLKVDR